MEVIYDVIPNTNLKDYLFDKNQTIDSFFSITQIKEKVEKVLSKVNNKLLEYFEKDNWKIIITNRKKLEEEYLTIYQVDGITDFDKKEIIVYATENGIEYSLIHELGHYLDKKLYDVSKSSEWFKMYQENNSKCPLINNYSIQYFTDMNRCNEVFADSFLVYTLDPGVLKRYMPDVYNLFVRINYSLDYLDDCSKSIII